MKQQLALVELRNRIAAASDAARECDEKAMEQILVGLELLVIQKIVLLAFEQNSSTAPYDCR